MDILLIRLSAIGDVVMSTSLIQPLLARHPGSRIVWLTEEFGAELLAHHPLLDQVWILPRRSWRHCWKTGRFIRLTREVLAFLRQWRSRSFDWVLDLQGIPKSAVWTRLSRARRRIILNPHDGAQFLVSEKVHPPRHHARLVCSEYRYLAEYLHLPEAAVGMSLEASPQAQVKAAQWAVQRPRPRVFFFPFTTRPQKHWIPTYWNDLGTRLHQQFGARITVLGGPGDAEAARTLIEGIPQAEVVAGPQSHLDEKMSLIPHADLCIGVDTGLTHMSLAFARPTIAIFGSTRPYLNTTPLPCIVMYDGLECAPCRRHPTCNGRFDCMRAITVDRVVQAAQSLLSSLTQDDSPPSETRLPLP